MRFVHEHEWVNDGGWHQTSALERAIGAATMAAYSEGYEIGFNWTTLTVEKMECDNRDKDDPASHYPKLCYHYRIILEGPDPEPEEHTCPYKEEILGDYDTMCTCDKEQVYQCQQDI